MSSKRFFSLVLTGLGALAVAPAFAKTANAEPPIPLDGSQCWGRCSACTAHCASAFPSERSDCERTCQARNSRCCEASGRHGVARSCGCD